MERTAIFPGSFDPFTRGHAALVDEALNLFDRVVIGIGNNTAKTGLLTVANRKRLMEATNHRIYPDITTVMLFTPSPVADISSSTVREVLSFGRSVEEFMPKGIDINKYL